MHICRCPLRLCFGYWARNCAGILRTSSPAWTLAFCTPQAFKIGVPVLQIYAQGRFHRLPCLVGVHLRSVPSWRTCLFPNRLFFRVLFLAWYDHARASLSSLAPMVLCVGEGAWWTTTLEKRPEEHTTPGIFFYTMD